MKLKHRPRGRQILRVQEKIMFPWHFSRWDKDDDFRESFEDAFMNGCYQFRITAVVEQVKEDTGFLSPRRALPGILLNKVEVEYVVDGERKCGQEEHLWLFGTSYALMRDHVDVGATVTLDGALYPYLRLDGRRNFGFEAQSIIACKKVGVVR